MTPSAGCVAHTDREDHTKHWGVATYRAYFCRLMAAGIVIGLSFVVPLIDGAARYQGARSLACCG